MNCVTVLFMVISVILFCSSYINMINIHLASVSFPLVPFSVVFVRIACEDKHSREFVKILIKNLCVNETVSLNYRRFFKKQFLWVLLEIPLWYGNFFFGAFSRRYVPLPGVAYIGGFL